MTARLLARLEDFRLLPFFVVISMEFLVQLDKLIAASGGRTRTWWR